ncbi:MAG: DUF401 family protein, partial [Anaerolineae bacterium]|nr:DUF401 family protein [Anaerolineae bacterium]
ERKTFINYWFRHSMEYVFPLYTSLLMMAALLQVTVYDFIRASWPLTFVALIGGFLWGFVGLEHTEQEHGPTLDTPAIRGHWRKLFINTWPLLFVILMVVFIKANMLVSLGIVIVLFAVIKSIAPDQWLDVVKRGIPLKTFTSIMGVMVFKHVLEDAGAVEQIPVALSSLGLPPMLVAYIVPMIVGLLTGTAAAALALSIPLVAPLLASQPLGTPGALEMSTAVWLYVSSFSGILMSPLHLCLALTREYFGASWGLLYRRIIPAVAFVVLFALVLVFIT